MFSLFHEYRRAARLAEEPYDIIFFAESRSYFQYFRHLFENLVLLPRLRIAYLTADPGDPVLQDSRVEGVYLKHTLAGIFPRLRARLLIMTMPDLQNFIFKRSATVENYVYVFHALVSTHQQYRRGALDHYDAVFCTGPQQEGEIRETERRCGLRPKELVQYGYPLLEELRQAQKQPQPKKVLVAPSWYAEGILNTCALPLLESLTTGGYETWLRPHPEFVKRQPKTWRKLQALAAKSERLFFDDSPSVFTHLADAAHLVTDRSGIAFEYAFATKRPVLFVDTPLKQQNSEASSYPMEPLENVYRSLLGISVAPQDVKNAAQVLASMEAGAFRSSIEKAEKETVFPFHHHQNGLAYCQRLLPEKGA